MRLVHFTLYLSLILVAGCQKPSQLLKQVPAAQVMSYPANDNEFIIIVVEDNDITKAEAKAAAKQKAAEVALDHGFRYFSILAEGEIVVMKSSQAAQFPGNLYQELIIEHEFGKETLEREQASYPQTYPAFRLSIKCYAEKPLGKKTFDAQELVQ